MEYLHVFEGQLTANLEFYAQKQYASKTKMNMFLDKQRANLLTVDI